MSKFQMIKSYQHKKALLIGNGINLLDSGQSFSWGKLLQELKNIYTIDVDLDNVFKPFPIAFDEMLHQKPGNNVFRDKIKILKQHITNSIERQLENKNGYNDYHTKLVLLDYDDILTTNYDYSLQKSVEKDFIKLKAKFAQNKQERKYSLKRSYKMPNQNKVIWHIHGELFDSRSLTEPSKYYKEESIMIGYEHYSSYLQRIQENIKGKSGTQKIDNQSLMIRLRNQTKSPFWTDIFFTHHLDIVGQGFDFSENHLWWLVNFRANAIRETNPKHDVQINNTIRFFYPQINGSDQFSISDLNNLEIIIKKKNNVQKSRAIADVLKAFNIVPMPIQCESYPDFYNKLVNQYLNNTIDD